MTSSKTVRKKPKSTSQGAGSAKLESALSKLLFSGAHPDDVRQFGNAERETITRHGLETICKRKPGRRKIGHCAESFVDACPN